ncbi:sigma factor-like helix-turn-helix DNA-binding protein [Kocuria sp. M1R5S2]|uniref:sigma factor-like helix-turn-helix DNA-binding protein n=1 Tax=Kocuria rhizosphaerae TaxID=3376285 RepID=UPI0037A7690D
MALTDIADHREMSPDNPYHWISFYEVVATRLLDFRDDRVPLARAFDAVRADIGSKVYPDVFPGDTEGPVQDMCPFTIMWLYSQDDRDGRRTRLAELVASQLGLDVPVPTSFTGATMTRLKQAWWFHYAKTRTDEVDRLWRVFVTGCAWADHFDDPSREADFTAALEALFEKFDLGWRIATGLFYARPRTFFPLQRNHMKLTRDMFGIQLPRPGEVGAAAAYVSLLRRVHQYLATPTAQHHSIAELSVDAEGKKAPVTTGREFSSERIQTAPAGAGQENDLVPDEASFGVDHLFAEGCFPPSSEIDSVLDTRRHKKNVILQDAPGTGNMTESWSLGDVCPTSWLDAFPWLRGVAGPDNAAWWDDAIEDAEVVERHQRLAQIAELAMERLTRWPIGQIFPGLSPNIELQRLQLPVRAVNALARRGFISAADIVGMTVESIMDWPQVGIGTVDDMLRALADASTSQATPTVMKCHEPASFHVISVEEYRSSDSMSTLDKDRQTAEAASPFFAEEQRSDMGTLPADTAQPLDRMLPFMNDLAQVARWYVTVGLTELPIFGRPVPPGAPNEIVEAQHRLEKLRSEDILCDEELGMDVAKLFGDVLSNLDERAVYVLANRVFADRMMTLDDIGNVFGVTRERIRQVEGKARGAMLGCFANGSAIEMVANSVRALMGTIRPLEDLITVIPALGKSVDLVQQPAWRVLDRLDDSYEIEDGWCVVPSMDSARSVTQAQLQERADPYGVVLLDDLDLVETSRPECRAELTAEWLTHCGYIIESGHVLSRTRSVGDYGAAILSIVGSPLSTQQILDRFVFERSARSFRNAMGTDERFERVDKDLWALKEWGLEAYSGIRSVIRERVAQCGGRADLNELVEYITGRYTVTASSVVAYASAPPFTCKQGIVRLVTGDPGGPRKSPEQTRRMFRRQAAWAYRVRITSDHFRGSGSVAPMAVASILDLEFGETRQLESALGPQSVAWTGLQPQFGTIRRFLMEQDIPVSAEAFLVIHDNGTFTFDLARELTGIPLLDALTLIGAPMTTNIDQARAAVAAAVGLPDTSPVSSVIGTYRERGDSDIAELLTSVRETLETGHAPVLPTYRADVNEILDLL